MLPCRIEIRPAFLKILAKLKSKRFRRVQKDLDDLFPRIIQAPRQTANARRYELGDEQYEAYTYDCKSTDMGKGAINAFRVIARYDKIRNIVTPITMIYKGDVGYVPADEVLRAIQALDAASESEPPDEQSPASELSGDSSP